METLDQQIKETESQIQWLISKQVLPKKIEALKNYVKRLKIRKNEQEK